MAILKSITLRTNDIAGSAARLMALACLLVICNRGLGQPPTSVVGESQPQASQGGLATEQKGVADRFGQLEALLLRRADLEAAENPSRAALLKQAVQLSKQADLTSLLADAASRLEQGQYSEAIEKQKSGRENLKRLLELLQSENREERIREERDEVRRWIEETDRLLRLQSSLRGRTEGGQDTQQAAGDQNKLADKAAEISQQLGGGSEAVDSQDGDQESSDAEDNSPQGDAQSPPKSGQPSDEARPPEGDSDSPSPAEDGDDQSKPGESDESNPEGSKPGENEPGDSKPGESKPGESPESKPGDSGESKPGESQSSESQPSESQPSESQPSESQPSESQPSESQPSESQPSESQPSESQPSESQSGQPAEGQPSQGPPAPGSSEQSGEQSNQPPQTPTERAKQRIEQAQQKMKEAQEELEKAEREGAVEKQREAEDRLREAIEELEEILRQLREEEIERSLATLETRLRRMLEMQNQVLDETMRLQEISGEEATRQVQIMASKLSLDERKILAEGERAYLLLREEGSSAAFPEAIEQLNTDVSTVAERLANGDVGKLTVVIETEIVSSLEEMVAALVQVQKENREKRQQQQGQGQQGQPGDQPLVDKLAELRLIRTLQVRINNRTGALSKLLDNPEDAVGQAQAEDILENLRGLSERQSSIGRVTRDIVVGKGE